MTVPGYVGEDLVRQRPMAPEVVNSTLEVHIVVEKWISNLEGKGYRPIN
jgi:hypothetical protein